LYAGDTKLSFVHDWSIKCSDNHGPLEVRLGTTWRHAACEIAK